MNYCMRVFFALGLAIAAIGCASSPAPKEPISALPASLEPVVEVVKKSAFEEAMDKAAILSQNGGNPIAFPGGALIAYGDTFLGRKTEIDGSVEFLGAVTNALMKLERKDGTVRYEYLTDSKGAAREFLPLRSTEAWTRYRLWPGGGAQVNGHFYVFYELIDQQAPKGSSAGSQIGLARSTSGWVQWERLALKGKFPFASVPHAVVESKDGNLYAYFLEKRGDSSVVRVARVAAGSIESPSAYQVLAPVLAQDVFGQVSVAWNDYLQSYVMCHAGHAEKDPRAVYIRRSPSPSGPFSEPEPVLRLSDPPSGGGLSGQIYSPYLYPELFRENGRIMTFSYCIMERQGRPHLHEFEVRKTTLAQQ